MRRMPRQGVERDHDGHRKECHHPYWATSTTFPQFAKLADNAEADAEYLESVPLVGRPGVRFADQARIHPRKYLAGVAKAFVALGGRIHEHSEADEFCDDPRRVKANGHTVMCETALAHARLAAIPVDRIVNCWPSERLLAWLSDPSSECRR
jgi:glycine/D-amino acid oxidase-like deaminating enzyme